MPTIREAYLLGAEHLRAAGSPEPAIEAEMLLRHALRWSRTELYTRWESLIEPEPLSRYQGFLETRASGRPVHYIIGEREFMGLAFTVDERVLIPRPETEVLVQFLIEICRLPAADSSKLVIVDVGTGSGCIAVSLAHYVPHVEVYATDISRDALEVAAANARRHDVADRIVFLEGDLLAPLPDDLLGNVQIVASNPPYVPLDQAPIVSRDIREFEPAVAVFGLGDGMSIHRRLIDETLRWLGPRGLLAMEVAAGQADSVRGFVAGDGRFTDIRVLADLVGIERVVAARRL